MNRGLAWGLAAIVALAAAFVVAPFFLGSSSQTAGPGGSVGSPVPIFALRDDVGAPVSLAHYRGKLVVINLWASWCPPCRAEMPDLQRLANSYAARGVIVVGVNQGESPERARAFARSLGIRFPIWVDDRQQYGRLFGALGLPTTAIVARNGVVAAAFDGALTYDEMRRDVAPLLGSR